MNRPQLRKIVLIDYLTDAMKDAVREAAPEATLVPIEDKANIAREIVDAQMLIGDVVPAEILRSATELFWHHRPNVGVDRLLNPAYAENQIILTNGKGTSSANIAEHVIAMMLAFARDLPGFLRDQANREWRLWDDGSRTIFELGGQRVLCLGTGNIGQEVARRLAIFGCEVMGASRSGILAPGFLRCTAIDNINDELAVADHIVNSLPMTPATAGIVSREMIFQMKPGARFYNVGRGGTVDQDALIEALQTGHLAAAGLDVTMPEPPEPESPLWDMPNVIITGHTAGDSHEAHQRAVDLVVEQLRRYQTGEELLNVVDLTAGY